MRDSIITVYKIAEDEFMISNEVNLRIVNAYVTMLENVHDFQFVETIEGQHYYKESEYSKSNVYSIKVKNSGLSYDTMSFNDVRRSFEQNGETPEATVRAALSQGSVKLLIEDSDILKMSDGSDIEDDADLRNYRYVISDESDLIESKIKIRDLFEDAVRKSIGRYAPVNTTLWKIKYDN